MPTDSVSPQPTQPKLEVVEPNVIAVIPSDNSTASNTDPIDLQPSDTTAPSQTVTIGNEPQSVDPSPSTASSPRSPPPGTINMSGLRTTLPDTLNSPSTNIIGTPFAHTTAGTPFEYPFPDTSSDSASPPPSHPSYRPGSPQASFHPLYTGFHPPPPIPDISSSATINLVHPKLKPAPPASPPPIPPSLKKKRWSLNILGRRRSNPPTPGEGPSSPLGCPPGATSGAILGGLGSGRPRLNDKPLSGGVRATEDSRKSLDTQ